MTTGVKRNIAGKNRLVQKGIRLSQIPADSGGRGDSAELRDLPDLLLFLV